ncbi:MAG: hypothetical protein PUG65_01600, partial [Firmicutes bacterium]|nr:hypothetical protein [Bacillota bacterium]
RMQADEISKFGRDTQGVRVMRLKDDSSIMSIALTPHEDEEELDENGNPIDAQSAAEVEQNVKDEQSSVNGQEAETNGDSEE